jgi:hypothetical protein
VLIIHRFFFCVVPASFVSAASTTSTVDSAAIVNDLMKAQQEFFASLTKDSKFCDSAAVASAKATATATTSPNEASTATNAVDKSSPVSSTPQPIKPSLAAQVSLDLSFVDSTDTSEATPKADMYTTCSTPVISNTTKNLDIKKQENYDNSINGHRHNYPHHDHHHHHHLDQPSYDCTPHPIHHGVGSSMTEEGNSHGDDHHHNDMIQLESLIRPEDLAQILMDSSSSSSSSTLKEHPSTTDAEREVLV